MRRLPFFHEGVLSVGLRHPVQAGGARSGMWSEFFSEEAEKKSEKKSFRLFGFETETPPPGCRGIPKCSVRRLDGSVIFQPRGRWGWRNFPPVGGLRLLW